MIKETEVATEFILRMEERKRLEELGEKLQKLAYEKAGISKLTKTLNRSWYDDSWTETVTDWSAVARLFEALKIEIDT